MSVSREERAYAEALRLCREAEASGASALAFDFELRYWLTKLPHGFEAIVEDEYRGLRTMLKKRAIADSGR